MVGFQKARSSGVTVEGERGVGIADACSAVAASM